MPHRAQLPLLRQLALRYSSRGSKRAIIPATTSLCEGSGPGGFAMNHVHSGSSGWLENFSR